MNIKEFRRELKRVKKAVEESLLRCEELLWQSERDGLSGQERTDAEEALSIVERLRSVKRIL